MDELADSLNEQHAQLARKLDAVIAAGRAARWPEYHRQLGALGEGLVQQMTFEEEALFPALERGAAAAVKALREGHAGLRRHLEMLGAAAPEQDPEGCVAALGELAAEAPGAEGRAHERELVALAESLGLVVAGPNGQGVISTPRSMCAQIVAPYPPAGRISILAP